MATDGGAVAAVEVNVGSAEPVPAQPPAKAKPKKRRGKRPPGRKLFQYDRALGFRYVAGADEAGRGCLAGPLTAAGVLFDMQALGLREVKALAALNDSKQHTHAGREALYPLVLRCATRAVVVSRSCESIDRRGLHRTNLDALRDALARVSSGFPEGEVICLSDGFRVPDLGREQRAIVDGDCTSAAIAAASILAKVARDRFMVRAEARHPGWAFGEHMGYSTPVHREAIRRRGVSPLHRMSFASTAYQQLSL
ncbi:MAG: ribonuclease [Solirubrobacterales bacterium]|nr:ribonuclease [Solirubrobacterales bacterium]